MDDQSINEELTSVSFFSGALGLDLGLERANIKSVLYSEIDPVAQQTIIANRPNAKLIGDLRSFSPDDIRSLAGRKIDVVVGGPPCQAFSTAGKRKGLEDSRGNVFLKFLDMIAGLTPDYVIIENVRGLMSAVHEGVKGGVLLHVVKFLRDAGYRVTFNLYNAAHYGAPQVRERVVIVCTRGWPAGHLRPTHCDDPGYGLPPWVTFREATAGLTHHDYVQFPERRLKYFRMLKAGQNWRSLPKEVQKEAMGKSFDCGGGRTGFFRRLAWDKPSPTLVTCPTMPATDLCHPDEDRPLSIQEYKRLQGFPDDWVVCGNLEDQYRQLGNAVPVKLGEAAGKVVQNHRHACIPFFPMKHEEVPRGHVYHMFKFSRYKRTSEREWLEDHERNRPLIDVL